MKTLNKSLINKISLGFMSLTLISGCSFSNNNLNLPVENNTNVETSGNVNNQFDSKGISKTTVLVKLKSKFSKSQVNSFENKYNTLVRKNISSIKILSLEIPKGMNYSQFISQLKKDSLVEYAEPDIKIELDETEVNFNDPMISKQYALEKVEASKAWAINQGKESVIVGIVDTGVDPEHPDLKNKLLEGYNAMEPGTSPKDDHRHGTHVSGIAAAIGNNGIGVAGLAVNCKILPVRTLGKSGGSLETVADGLVWAADNGADVVNMSLGTYSENQTLGEAVKYALGKNVVLIATMGNNNTERKRFPAGYDGVIAVGATDSNDNRARYSNYGSWITLSAPGSDILSTLPTYMSSGYGNLSGTSMAAPLVTGLAALVRSQNANMSPKDVTKILQDSSDDLGDEGFDKYFGSGRINAFKAVELAKKRR